MKRNVNTDIYYRADGSATDFDTLARECGASPEVIKFIHDDNHRQGLAMRYERENTDMRFETLAMRAEEHGIGEPWAYVPSEEPSPEDAFFMALTPVPTKRDMVLEVTGSLPSGQAEFVYMLFSADFMHEIALEIGRTDQAVHNRFEKVSKTLGKLIDKAHPEAMPTGI